MPDYFDPRSFGSLEIRQAEQAESIDQKIDYSRQDPGNSTDGN